MVESTTGEKTKSETVGCVIAEALAALKDAGCESFCILAVHREEGRRYGVFSDWEGNAMSILGMLDYAREDILKVGKLRRKDAGDGEDGGDGE